jgi:hypothetical protein
MSKAWWRGEWIETSVRCDVCKRGIPFPEASAAEPRTAWAQVWTWDENGQADDLVQALPSRRTLSLRLVRAALPRRQAPVRPHR